MNQSLKLSFFLGLEYKPLVSVILKCKNRMSIGAFSLQTLGGMFTHTKCEYVETFPERRTLEQALINFDSLGLKDTLWKDDYETWRDWICWSYS